MNPITGGVVANPATIHVSGRRWFRKSAGNTYYSATVIADGREVARIDYQYGYGQQYLWDAFLVLEQRGLITPREHSGEAPFRWAERHGVALTYDCVDVARKADL